MDICDENVCFCFCFFYLFNFIHPKVTRGLGSVHCVIITLPSGFVVTLHSNSGSQASLMVNSFSMSSLLIIEQPSVIKT